MTIDQQTNRPTQPTMGTAVDIERARAVAEVQAAVVVAQQCPRDLQAALQGMRESTTQQALADRAFFSYQRAGSQITGPSVHLARELARVWGNLQYGVEELRRDDAAGVSEMRAWAWDVQTNTRPSAIWIVPHARDTTRGRKTLTELRDIYENNANQGARRLREAIFDVLPVWFTEEAQTRLRETLQGKHSGKTVAQQISEALDWYDSAFRVSRDRVEAALGRPSREWTEHDVASLRVRGGSILRGETTADDEFPKLQRRASAAEITGSPTAPPAASAAVAAAAAANPASSGEYASDADVRAKGDPWAETTDA